MEETLQADFISDNPLFKKRALLRSRRAPRLSMT